MEIYLDDIKFDVYITRKNNKNMYLRVKPDGLYVSCHPFVSKRMILSFIERNKESIIEESKRLKYEDAEFVYYFTEKFAPLRKSIFEEYIYASFENRKYRIPKDFDELLKIQYGDYMKLPPEKDRINVHHAKIWWK